MAVFVSSVSLREGYSDDDDDWIKWLRQAVARSGRRHGTRRAAECECRWLLPPFAVCAFHRISVMTHPAAASKGSSFNKHRLIVYAARPSSTIATLLLAEVFNVGFHLSPAIRSSTSILKMRLVSLLFSCSFQTNHCLRLSIHNEWTFPEFDVLNDLVAWKPRRCDVTGLQDFRSDTPSCFLPFFSFGVNIIRTMFASGYWTNCLAMEEFHPSIKKRKRRRDDFLILFPFLGSGLNSADSLCL